MLMLPVLLAVHSYSNRVALQLHTPVVLLLDFYCTPIARKPCTALEVAAAVHPIAHVIDCAASVPMAVSAIAVVCNGFVASEAAGAVVLLPLFLIVLPLTAGVLLPIAAACTVSVASQTAAALLAILLPVLLNVL